MSVTRSNITRYFSPLSVYCGDKYVTPDVSDLRSRSYDCSSAPCSICRQDSGNEESTDADSSFSPAPTMAGTPEAWVVLMTHKMPFPMECFGDSEEDGKNISKKKSASGRWSSSGASCASGQSDCVLSRPACFTCAIHRPVRL